MGGSGNVLLCGQCDSLVENPDLFHQSPGKPVEHQKLSLFCLLYGRVTEIAIGDSLPVDPIQICSQMVETCVPLAGVGR